MSSVMDGDSETQNPSPYEQLPEAIRQYYSLQEYLWLSDGQKANLMQEETEPEWT